MDSLQQIKQQNRYTVGSSPTFHLGGCGEIGKHTGPKNGIRKSLGWLLQKIQSGC